MPVYGYRPLAILWVTCSQSDINKEVVTVPLPCSINVLSVFLRFLYLSTYCQEPHFTREELEVHRQDQSLSRAT